VDGVGTLQNRITVGFQTIHNMPEIQNSLQVAIRHQAEAFIQAGGGNMEYLL
jgi:hypothetical protein